MERDEAIGYEPDVAAPSSDRHRRTRSSTAMPQVRVPPHPRRRKTGEICVAHRALSRVPHHVGVRRAQPVSRGGPDCKTRSKTRAEQINGLARARTSLAATRFSGVFCWHESCQLDLVMIDIRW
jgi:hypothetical protein